MNNKKTMSDYDAHSSPDGTRAPQTLEEHARNTAALCRAFAESTGLDPELGYFAGVLHDFGKATDGFRKRLHGGAVVDHASAGALTALRAGQIELAMAILGHHTGLADMGNPQLDTSSDSTFFGRIARAESGEIELPHIEPPDLSGLTLPPDAMPGQFFSVSMLTRMLYSCLVDADFLDTEHYMRPELSREYEADSIEVLNIALDTYLRRWNDPTREIDRLRSEILRNCIAKAEDAHPLWTLTAPTGSGKTVSSLAFALRHAEVMHKKRVIYVIPYLSIIDQTAEIFRTILGDRNVLEHHSGIEPDRSDAADERTRKLALASENWDMPVIVTTSVQFFESLYSNRSSRCRKLHNIANSVIVFDEAQMLPVQHLKPCVWALSELIRNYHCTAVLCTATQPELSDLFGENGLTAKELCPEPKRMAEAFRRIRYENIGILDAPALAERLESHDQVLCIVNSRVGAHDVYQRLPESEENFHLTTLMAPEHRRAVLHEIRRRLDNGLPVRVVSTSLLEAGVDVDFPVGYRELSGQESMNQSGGRINREGHHDRKDSVLYVFEGVSNPPKVLARNIQAAKEALSMHEDIGDPETTAEYFRILRKLVGDSIDSSDAVRLLNEQTMHGALLFETVAARFRFITDGTCTVYIPNEKNTELMRKLRSGFASRAELRKANRYAVSVYPNQYQRLRDCGVIDPLSDDAGILLDPACYDDRTGLVIPDSEPIGYFM